MLKNKTSVYLVGAGPGDPELLTMKAYNLLQQADVIVYDRLVSKAIIALIPRGVKKIYVGKAAGKHHMNQLEINQLLVHLAKASHKVIRLKGGDPFIFGRGSEEASFLIENNVQFEYVPGITAASACSAYAGIPLTHRGVASSVRLITGHGQADESLDLNWNSLADVNTTLVFYMGLASLPYLRQKLIAAGLPKNTPAAAIENGTRQSQRRCISNLDELPSDVIKMSIKPPAIIIIGDVVKFSNQLNWFRPLLEDDVKDNKICSKA